MLSRLRIFSTPPFFDSDIRVENFLENTQKFYDGGARLDIYVIELYCFINAVGLCIQIE
jgi:hypothetical protein